MIHLRFNFLFLCFIILCYAQMNKVKNQTIVIHKHTKILSLSLPYAWALQGTLPQSLRKCKCKHTLAYLSTLPSTFSSYGKYTSYMQNIVIVGIIHHCTTILEYLKSSYDKAYSQFLEEKSLELDNTLTHCYIAN